MPSITINGIPAPVHARLKAIARRNHRRLNQEIIAALSVYPPGPGPIDGERIIKDVMRVRGSVKTPVDPADFERFRKDGRP